MINFPPVLKNLYLRFYEYPLFIQIALIVSAISFATFLLTNLVISLQRVEYTSLETRLLKLRKIVTGEITFKLMLKDRVKDKDIDGVVRRFNKIALTNKLVRQVVTEELIYLRRNFSGYTATVLDKLYNRLNFMKSSTSKLESSSWDVQAEGLREFQELPVANKDIALINPMLNDKNNDVRIEAQGAYIRLNRHNPFKFLDSATEELLEWHQFILFEIIINTPRADIPAFSKWLHSDNMSVITFSIKLIVHYQQLKAIPKIIKLLDHNDGNVKDAAIYALGELGAEESEQKLIEIFQESALPIKIKILEAIGSIGSGKSESFLTDQYLMAEDFSLIKTAGCALGNQPGFDEDKFSARYTLSLKQKTILKHCLNSLIRN